MEKFERTDEVGSTFVCRFALFVDDVVFCRVPYAVKCAEENKKRMFAAYIAHKVRIREPNVNVRCVYSLFSICLFVCYCYVVFL